MVKRSLTENSFFDKMQISIPAFYEIENIQNELITNLSSIFYGRHFLKSNKENSTEELNLYRNVDIISKSVTGKLVETAFQEVRHIFAKELGEINNKGEADINGKNAVLAYSSMNNAIVSFASYANKNYGIQYVLPKNFFEILVNESQRKEHFTNSSKEIKSIVEEFNNKFSTNCHETQTRACFKLLSEVANLFHSNSEVALRQLKKSLGGAKLPKALLSSESFKEACNKYHMVTEQFK